MRFSFVDDSYAFDGYSPSSQPMGGPEKAFALLPLALAQRGHAVTAFSRTTYATTVDGAKWESFDVAPGVKPLIDLVNAARDRGILVLRPQGDFGMAEAYRAARVHLHPGTPNEIFGFTLAESQCLGLPAVVRPAAPVLTERVIDGQTGRITANDASFAAAAIC